MTRHRRPRELSSAAESTADVDSSSSGAPGSPVNQRSRSHNPADDVPDERTPSEKHPIDPPEVKRWQNWRVRTVWTLIMISAFFLVIAAGHFWVACLVIAIQTLVYREVIAIAYVPSREMRLPLFRTQNWYFLITMTYFLYGESLYQYFQKPLLVDAFLQPLARHHRFISFSLYVIGFVMFVANLRKGHYRFQLRQFGWTHMTLLLVTAQSHFIANNIFEGMIWFFLPVSLVVVNDIFAYITGFFFGRTPLIKLSPKKTVEGFVGAWICTVAWGVLITEILRRIPYMLCPAKDFSQHAWNFEPCELSPVFLPVRYHLTPWLSALLRRIVFRDIRDIWIAPIQFHTFVLACFASLIAPFGGFFASGVKRAFKIKDFGDSIPGHGGLTDRMDCQFLMGMFSYVYYQSFIRTSILTVGAVLASIVNGLTPEQQLELYDSLGELLTEQHLLPNVQS